VVLRQLPQLAVAQQVDARVADLADEVAAPGEDEHRGGGPHPLLVRLGDRALEDRHVRVAQRGGDAGLDGGVVEVAHRAELAGDDLHGHLARHLAGGVTAHPVGDDEEAARLVRVGEEAVLVARADHADVRPRGVLELH
jgi:hypothetical protein